MTSAPEFPVLLREQLAHHGRSPVWLAKQIGHDPETVQAWLRGDARPENRQTVNRIIAALPITDPAAQAALRRAAAYPPDAAIHQSNFHGQVTGPIHTGSGDINLNPISWTAVTHRLDQIFRWSEAPEHSRSSWAGMILWSLSTTMERLSPKVWLAVLSAAALWIATAWLIIPMLQWPLPTPQSRLTASLRYALAGVLIPLLVAALSGVDGETAFTLDSGKKRMTLWFLKSTGALVGFGAFAAGLFFLSLGVYYLTETTLPDWLWWGLILIPLLFSHVAARRIPADRYKMFGQLQAHDADKWFFAVFLLFGPLLAGFVYLFYGLLAERITGFVFLLVLAGIALWEQRKRASGESG